MGLIRQLSIPGVALVEAKPHVDDRGQFVRWYCHDDMGGTVQDRPILQINCSLSHEKGTLRGLHFQRPPAAEDKAVRCIRGAIFDVVVDLRAGSTTFGKWLSVELDAISMAMLVVPRGFAHGFMTLTDDTEVMYLHTEVHTPHAEDGIHHASPALGIRWPLAVSNLSDRDRNLVDFDPESEPGMDV